MEKKIKELPIFWTYLMENGVATIHQVRFRGLYVKGREDGNGFVIQKAIFNIAGCPETFIGRGKHCITPFKTSVDGDTSKRYFPLDLVFATKERAESAVKKRNLYSNEVDFYTSHIDGETYEITTSNPLYGRCEWWWGNFIPSNMKLKETNDGVVKLCGYRWNGIESGYHRVLMERKLTLVDNIAYDNISEDPLFNMVDCSWVGKFKYEYFRTKEECDKHNVTKVFVFD